ncbi:MAG: GNAT family N-acetyltransferase [Rhodospirillales bacterium]|nr:GNAT family N-acetyltransferase [Rhodospirillales bacterium]
MPESTPIDSVIAKPRLVVRNARAADVEGILALTRKVYGDIAYYNAAMIRGHVSHYPEGQFVAVFEGRIVGYSASFRIAGEVAMRPHSWVEITGGGFASRHDPAGDHLYGMEVCVDPGLRGLRIGQRLYNERKKLCQHRRLRGIVFGGRLPGLARRAAKVGGPEAYVEMVKNRQLRDPVLSFQLRNGFEVVGLLRDYFADDKASLGYAALLLWRNPRLAVHPVTGRPEKRGRLPDTVRVAVIQYQQRRVLSFEEFGRQVEYFVDVVSDYGADFAVFPEMFTLQLLSFEDSQASSSEAIAALTRHVERFKEMLSAMAVRFNINIIGGSIPCRDEKGALLNTCFVFLRDGSIHAQPKIHPTPNERYWWSIDGGRQLRTIETDCGPVGVLICYDCEFPELARHLVDQGAQILFVPFCTDERQSYLRVRYCAQARAVENQCYVVMAGNVGNLPGVQNMDIQYAQSCVLTPCDFPFARDGVAADTTPNVETVAFADLRLESLNAARNSGTVQNLKDRRFDLYAVTWRGGD